MTEKELLLKTAETLQTLKKERNSLLEKETQQKAAFEITQKLVDSGQLGIQDILPKIAELSEQSVEDLKIYAKAMELTRNTNVFKLGSIADIGPGIDSTDRFTEFLLED